MLRKLSISANDASMRIISLQSHVSDLAEQSDRMLKDFPHVAKKSDLKVMAGEVLELTRGVQNSAPMQSFVEVLV